MSTKHSCRKHCRHPEHMLEFQLDPDLADDYLKSTGWTVPNHYGADTGILYATKGDKRIFAPTPLAMFDIAELAKAIGITPKQLYERIGEWHRKRLAMEAINIAYRALEET